MEKTIGDYIFKVRVTENHGNGTNNSKTTVSKGICSKDIFRGARGGVSYGLLIDSLKEE